ncbi:MAG TPA: hypothetical protein VKF62_03515 [Planctomycetota bacterium]|nr:hypothetical protein [Planctomycetota bacterium]
MKRSVRVLAGVAAIVVALFTARQLYAQVPTVKGRGKVLSIVEIIQNGVGTNTTTGVYSVPVDRRLVITDLMIADTSGSTSLNARILRSGTPATANLTVTAERTLCHSFATGIEFSEGQLVSVVNGDSAGPLNFYLRGYLTTP